MKSVAVILAAGSGSRTGLDIPKQFLMLAGKCVLEHSVDTFCAHPGIEEVVIVVATEYIDKVQKLSEDRGWQKVKHIVQGGKERYHSTLAAVDIYRNQPDCNMLIHDAARPLVTTEIIDKTIEAMNSYTAADVAIPVADTIVESHDSGNTMDTVLNRDILYSEQTPQAFRRSVLEEAYRIALQDPDFKSTDDCGTVIKYMPQVPVAIVPGSTSNIKLTYASDIPMIEWLLSNRNR